MKESLQRSYRRFYPLDYIMIAILGVITLWFIGWLTFGDSIRYFGFINAGGVIFALLLLFTAFIFLLRRRWIAALLSITLGAWLLFYVFGTNIAASEDRILASDIRIMTSSLRGLNRDMTESAIHLHQYDADIIGLQEVYDANLFKASLEKASGKKWYMLSEGKLTILAQYPIKPSNVSIKGVLSVRILMPEQALNIWTLHAPKTFGKPLLNRQFFKKLATEIKTASPDAVIGDFNSSPWNEGYLRTAKTMVDAHKSAGFGLGNSFPARGRKSGILGAFTRIDHIFVKRGVNIVNSFRGEAYIKSDHHPVIADIRPNS